ncbi:hypothetical protein F4777DRAFT_54705 [Nemania sp. FL0916]|nr:hypothetical protein F4777DRAFT_54705 [Nemania sp. FL0916]
MEGILLVPPDRGTILGRAIWKPRYVVIGPLAQKEAHAPNLSLSQVLSTARIRDAGGRSSKSLQKVPTDTIYLSVYKSMDDAEPVIQHSIGSITDCQVQQVAHRKQGHVQPTLTVRVSPDPATDKLRKRRSSRTTGLMTGKDSGSTTLWFVTGERSQYGLDDWAEYIQALMQHHQSISTMNPVSPTAPTFAGSYTSAHEAAGKSAPVTSTKGKLRSKLKPKSSGKSQPSAREQSSVYASESPSLRSRKSDLSSHASSMVPAAMNFVQQHYASMHQPDLPSPTSLKDEYSEQFIEGWTSAQGRSSALSSPIRGRGSVSSAHDHSQPSLGSSPPIAPRETILDRAFQMRYIPGSEREIAGEEKLTSLARFEALMREAESRQTSVRGKQPTYEPLKSTWEHDESDEDGGDDDDSDNYAFEQNVEHDEMDASTFKALRFIANRHNSIYSDSGLSTAPPSVLRPHTAHSRTRPTAQRTSSQSYMPMSSSQMLPSSRPADVPAMRRPSQRSQRSHEKRHSTSEVKNFNNFNDFAKRLSGTSSLLLVQSNTSTGSNRASGDYDPQYTPRGSVSPHGGAQVSADERRHWRGSIGVFGNEGGFL